MTSLTPNGPDLASFNPRCPGSLRTPPLVRIPLPIAPQCNIQCNFCHPSNGCVNAGVHVSPLGNTRLVYSSQQAVDQVQNSLAATPGMAVAEIAGPGDPLATPELTLETLRLLRQHVPNLILSVATNGMGLTPEFVKALAKVGVSHVTITVNVVDPDLGQHIYRWCRDGRQLLQGHLAASRLLERQKLAVQALKASGLMVTVHTVVMPGINNHHVVAIAREMKALGADRQTCLPLYPSPQTPFAVIPMPTPAEMAELRHRASRFLPQGSDCG